MSDTNIDGQHASHQIDRRHHPASQRAPQRRRSPMGGGPIHVNVDEYGSYRAAWSGIGSALRISLPATQVGSDMLAERTRPCYARLRMKNRSTCNALVIVVGATSGR